MSYSLCPLVVCCHPSFVVLCTEARHSSECRKCQAKYDNIEEQKKMVFIEKMIRIVFVFLEFVLSSDQIVLRMLEFSIYFNMILGQKKRSFLK